MLAEGYQIQTTPPCFSLGLTSTLINKIIHSSRPAPLSKSQLNHRLGTSLLSPQSNLLISLPESSLSSSDIPAIVGIAGLSCQRGSARAPWLSWIYVHRLGHHL